MPSTQDLLDALRQAVAISILEEDEAEPYKHKYQAADLLKKVLGERAICSVEPPPSAEGNKEQLSPSEPPDKQPVAASGSTEAAGTGSVAAAQQPSEADIASAAARVRCGLILLETDLLADGEASITAGLPCLEKFPEDYLAWLLESYNAMGALYSERGDLEVALEWLNKAEELYQRVTHTGAKHAHLATLAPPQSPVAAAAAAAAAAPAKVPAAVDETAVGAATDAGTRAAAAAPASEQTQEQQDEPPGAATAAAEAAAEEELQTGPGSLQTASIAAAGSEATAAAASAAVAVDVSVSVSEAVGSEGPESVEPTDWAAEAAGAAHGGGGGADAVGPMGEGTAAESEQEAMAEERELAAAGEQGAAAAAAAEAPPLHARLPGNDMDAVQERYTSTLYYLAQVYGHRKAADRSALYCAATLYRQLASGKYDLDTWVNNCLQLGGYYAKVNAFGLAMYCHAAAQAVVDRDTAAGAVLGEDIAANIKLAAARVYGMRLAASHSRHVEGKQLEMHYPNVSYFPDYLRFSGLSVPSPDSFPWGDAALARTFEAARELFNSAMPYFKAALSYYQLDGWVTDHMGILMDMSNLYRCLAGFEPDRARCAAMHRLRAQLLEPLSGGLNPDHYPGLSRSIDLELAHIYREISDVRELQSGAQAAAKAAAAATASARFYQRFLRSFATSGSETATLPDRIDTDNEPYFLMASFGLGRMLHRMRGGAGGAAGKAEAGPASYEGLVVETHKHLRWTAEYVRRHGLESWTQEAQAAEELSELLLEQVRLRTMAAAAARRGPSS